MHGLSCLLNSGHIYKPGGGELEHDPAQHLVAEVIGETRELPGFVEDNTTYESHRFWVHFLHHKRGDGTPFEKASGVLIRVHHGGGWEVWRGDYMLAKALQRYGDNVRGLFLLCWYMIDSAKTARDAGRQEATSQHRAAFVEGRLKRRKQPGRNQYKVWIEPAPAVVEPIPA